jgi:hypothetical protein
MHTLSIIIWTVIITTLAEGGYLLYCNGPSLKWTPQKK